MAVLDDCRHYIMQTTAHEEKVEKCRMGANEPFPFACPENCLFYEPRKVSGAGIDSSAVSDCGAAFNRRWPRRLPAPP